MWLDMDLRVKKDPLYMSSNKFGENDKNLGPSGE